MSRGAVIEGLRDSIDDILGVRDIVAVLHDVYVVERTWVEGAIGIGAYRETETWVQPSPGIREFAHDLRLQEGGFVQQGDILLKNISKTQFPTMASVDLRVTEEEKARGIERFYKLDGKEFSVVNVREKYLTWNVLVRRRRSAGGNDQ